MARAAASPLVHLELHTGGASAACAFYAELCGWHPQRLQAGPRTYQALGLGGRVDGGVVECATPRPLWLPYVEVPDIEASVGRARELGAAVTLERREGSAGWRAVIATEAGGELALWQPKSSTDR